MNTGEHGSKPSASHIKLEPQMNTDEHRSKPDWLKGCLPVVSSVVASCLSVFICVHLWFHFLLSDGKRSNLCSRLLPGGNRCTIPLSDPLRDARDAFPQSCRDR